jgi:hypothetical protein
MPLSPNTAAFRFLARIVVQLGVFIVMVAAALALDVMAARLYASGSVLRPIGSIVHILSYGVLIVGIIIFCMLTFAEAWRYFIRHQEA